MWIHLSIRLICSVLLTTIFINTSQAQLPVVTDALRLTDHIYVPEKLHLHFDRAQYSAGETIWFKAYLLQGGLPSPLSKNLYVDFADEQGNVLLHHVSPLFQGGSSGSFTIPSAITTGSIQVNAYTRYMLNADSQYLFQHQLPLAQATTSKATPVAASSIRLTLFPEGGTLTEFLEQKIAFLATDASGRPVALQAALKDKSGQLLDSVKTTFNGMGIFRITPVAGQQYSLVARNPQGKNVIEPLPAATPQGVLLNVTGVAEYRQFTVRRTEGYQPAGKFQLLATLNGQAVYKASIDLSVRNNSGGQIPVAHLPSGVLLITLLDASLNPLAERASFINNDNYTIDAQLATIDLNLKKKGRNVIEMKYYDSIPAHYSISVIDADLPYERNQHIYSRLLLSGEVKGRIYQPAWYFNTYTDEAKQMLDLVMLTHGWRKFDWVQARTGTSALLKFSPDTAYLTLSGQLNGGNAAELRSLKEMTILMQTADSNRQLLFVPITTGGRMEIPDQLFFDTAKLYYQFSKNSLLTQKLNLQLNNGFVPATARLRLPAPWTGTLPDTLGRRRQLFFAQEQEKLRKLLRTTTLEGVVVESKKKTNLQLLDEKYANGMFSGGGDGYSFDVQNDVRARGATTVLQYLQGQVAGLQISGGAPGGTASVTWRGGAPGFFLDQMPVEADQLLNIPMNDVAYIKVFRPPFMGGFNASNGAIAVYTQRGSRSAPDNRAPAGMNMAMAQGYTVRKIFFEPDYSKGPDPDMDIRPTLYWNPFVMADGKVKRSRIIFYNNDISPRLRIIVEGLNASGQLMHLEKVVE